MGILVTLTLCLPQLSAELHFKKAEITMLCTKSYHGNMRRSPSLQDFTIDGQVLEDPDETNYLKAFRNKLVYVACKYKL